MHLDTWIPLHIQARQHEDEVWLKENLTEVCGWRRSGSPARLTDCNPLDNFIWGVSVLRVNAKYRNKSKDLIQKIKEVMGFLSRDTLAKACKSFRSRI